MHGDVMWVETMPLVNGKLKPSKFGSVLKFPTKNPNGADLVRILNQMISIIYSQGFTIAQIYWDDDSIIKKIKWGKIAHDIPFSLCGAGAHEPVSERQGRTLKERVRCIIADQTFPVCLDLVKHAVYYAMTSLNWISGIAGQPSPREAVAGHRLDA